MAPDKAPLLRTALQEHPGAAGTCRTGLSNRLQCVKVWRPGVLSRAAPFQATGEGPPCLCRLLEAAGVPWLVAAPLRPPSPSSQAFPLPQTPVCSFPKDPRHWALTQDGPETSSETRFPNKVPF